MKANLIELLELSIEPLKIQLAQIEQPDINQIDELDKRKKMIDKKLAELVDPGSAFRTAVAKEITVRREDIVNMLNEASVTLQSDTFNTLLKSPNARQSDGGKWVGRMLNDAIAEIGSSITLELNRVFSVIAAMPQFEGMLKFDFREYNQNIIIRDVQTSVPMNKRVTPMMSGIGIATISGSLFGPLGWLIGAGVGAFVAYRNQKDAGNMFTESNLRQVYQPQLSGAISSLNTYVNTRFQEFQQEWIGIITDRAKAYKNSLQESITNIQKVKQDISQAVTMRAQVQNRIKPLSAVKEMIVKSDV